MRRLFEHAMRTWPNLVHALRETQGQLVQNAEQTDFNFRNIAEFDLDMVRLTDAGQLDVALLRVSEKLKESVDRFWPDCPVPSYQQFLTERSERQTVSSTLAADQATGR